MAPTLPHEFDDAHILLRRRRHRKSYVDTPILLPPLERVIRADGARLGVAAHRKNYFTLVVEQRRQFRIGTAHRLPRVDRALD